MIKELTVVELLKEKIINEYFISCHKCKPDDFSRARKLTFQIVYANI